MHMRLALRKQEWDALKSERDAERLERQTARTQAAGASFFQRRGIRKAERNRVADLRRSKVAEIEELRRKEREGERKLAPDEPPENLGGGN